MDATNKPILRSGDIKDIFEFSPWPNRILGYDNWKKESRTPDDVQREYDQGHYLGLTKQWNVFKAGLGRKADLFDVLRFYRSAKKRLLEEFKKDQNIYKVKDSSHLISVGDDVFVGDLTLAEKVHDMILDQRLEDLCDDLKISGAVELGCGNGRNIFRLLANTGLKKCRAGDLSPNAVELGNQIASDCDLPVKFQVFNYYKFEDYQSITAGLENYLLYTVHSVEQLPTVKGNVIESILNLTHKPKLVAHFEPTIFQNDSGFGKMCERYAQLNKYNLDLYPVLRALEDQGRLKILNVEKRIWGYSTFNPTTIIYWQPV